MSEMYIIVAGSRDIVDEEFVHGKLDEIVGDKAYEIVSGTARGVDRLGESWAKKRGIKVKRFPANWEKYGKSAGYRRNEYMAAYADALVAFWDGESRGTKHMIDLARREGLDVRIVRTDV